MAGSPNLQVQSHLLKMAVHRRFAGLGMSPRSFLKLVVAVPEGLPLRLRKLVRKEIRMAVMVARAAEARHAICLPHIIRFLVGRVSMVRVIAVEHRRMELR